MDAEYFYLSLWLEIRRQLEPGWSVRLLTGKMLDGKNPRAVLLFRRDSDPLELIFSLKEFFKRFQDGTPELVIVKEILSIYRETIQVLNTEDFSGIHAWERVKKRITFQLISKEKNLKALENYVCEDFCDLAAVAVLNLQISETGIKSVRITHKLAENWGVTEREILETARKNTPFLYPAEFKSYKQMLADLGKEPDRELSGNEIFILTNTLGVYGATMIMYDSLMKRIYEIMGGKFVILPSSTQEVLILPFTDKTALETYWETVKTINRRLVSRREFLSDNVYLYDGDKVVVACDKNGVCYYEEDNDPDKRHEP